MITLSEVNNEVAKKLNALSLSSDKGGNNSYVVGFYMNFGSNILHVKSNSLERTVIDCMANQDALDNDSSNEQLQVTSKFLNQTLPMLDNHGLNEEDFKVAMKHEDPIVRKLTAANGFALAHLSKDADPSVRLDVVKRLTKEIGLNIRTRCSWIDGMMEVEEDAVVRQAIQDYRELVAQKVKATA